MCHTTPGQQGGAEFITRMTQEYRERPLEAQVIKIHQRARNKGLDAALDEPPSSNIHFTLVAVVGPEYQPRILGVLTQENQIWIKGSNRNHGWTAEW